MIHTTKTYKSFLEEDVKKTISKKETSLRVNMKK